ncbi:MAG: FosX/FosE/FosI family fosfomycin resistance hydrolase [Spirochaetes bacterium]|nr:FosX/FosE/FosI family fosfomycin resistance hydrolase [Spirochaetota bacterium]
MRGISHITFTVSDLERTAGMLAAVLDAEEVYASGNEPHSLARERFFVAGGVWIAVMEGGAMRERSYDHVAFAVPRGTLPAYRGKVLAQGLEILPGRGRVPGEGDSLYFYDYDNHLFELHEGSLEERLRAYGA